MPGYADSVRRLLYRPANLPAVARILLEPTGRLWLQNQHRAGDSDVLWRVFEFNGSPAFQLRLPDRFAPFVISGNRILGTLVDDDGVPRLARFRFDAAQ
jgi:hypothetical protein